VIALDRRAAIVLCGGRSTRMGQDKASLAFGDETMLQRVVRLVGETVGPIVVVAAPDQQVPELPQRVAVVRDRHRGRGPLEGLAAGLAAVPEEVEAAYATSCDVPLLRPALVERMFDLLGTHEIAVPRDGQHHHPLAAVYRPGVLEYIDRLLAADRLRPLFLFEQVATRVIPVDELRDVDPELDTLANLNRPEDYRAALERCGFASP